MSNLAPSDGITTLHRLAATHRVGALSSVAGGSGPEPPGAYFKGVTPSASPHPPTPRDTMPKTVDFHGTPINLPGFGAMVRRQVSTFGGAPLTPKPLQGMSMAYGATDDEASRKTLQTAIDIVSPVTGWH